MSDENPETPVEVVVAPPRAEEPPHMTNLMQAIAFVIVIGGLVICVVNPDTLTFKEYLDVLEKFAFAVAGLGFARALPSAAKMLNGGGS